MIYTNKQITFCGKLVYSDLGRYIVVSPNTDTLNISEILDTIYFSDNNKMNIKIMSGSKTLYNEQGNLLKKRGQYGIFDYHINGCNLEDVLFANCGMNVDVEIVADTVAALNHLGNGVVGYGQRQITSCAK